MVLFKNADSDATENFYAGSLAVLIGGNWLLFIWAVNNHHSWKRALVTLLTRW